MAQIPIHTQEPEHLQFWHNPAITVIVTLDLCFMNPKLFTQKIKIRKAVAAGVRTSFFNAYKFIGWQLKMRSTNLREVPHLPRVGAQDPRQSLPRDPNFVSIGVTSGKVCLPSLFLCLLTDLRYFTARILVQTLLLLLYLHHRHALSRHGDLIALTIDPATCVAPSSSLGRPTSSGDRERDVECTASKQQHRRELLLYLSARRLLVTIFFTQVVAI
jgi:hypothetical protein